MWGAEGGIGEGTQTTAAPAHTRHVRHLAPLQHEHERVVREALERRAQAARSWGSGRGGKADERSKEWLGPLTRCTMPMRSAAPSQRQRRGHRRVARTAAGLG